MLIKIGNTTVLNVTAIERITVVDKIHKKIIVPGFFKDKTESKTIYGVMLHYRDMDGKSDHYTLWINSGSSLADTFDIKSEILLQIKELELENMTQTLENAIRSN